MRSWVLAAIIIVGGLGVIIGVSAALADDNTGKTVSADEWADDVCGAVGAWQGEVRAIRDEIDESNYAARRNDGGSGDSVERTIILRVAIDRAIQATETLREGLKRAGNPEGAGGQAAALKLRTLATQIELSLRLTKTALDRNPDNGTRASYAPLSLGSLSLRRSYELTALNFEPELKNLGEPFSGSDNCQALSEALS